VVKAAANPYGLIPYIYVPTRRDLESFYGDCPGQGLMGIQDEINKRLADIGDYLNYSAHPIRWVRDFRGDHKTDLPVGPDTVWNLGKTINIQAPPSVGMLDAAPVPPGTYEHIGTLMSLTQDIVHIPPVAFGRDEGSQRSSMILVVRMWPLIQATRTSRIFWRSSLAQFNEIIFRILNVMSTGESRVGDKVLGHRHKPSLAPILPKDRAELVNEVIQRVESSLMAPLKALEELGEEDPEEQLVQIKQWQEYLTERGISVQKSYSQRSVVRDV